MLPFATPRKAFHHDEAQTTDPVLESSPTPFSTSVSTACGLAFNHRENAFVDFKLVIVLSPVDFDLGHAVFELRLELDRSAGRVVVELREVPDCPVRVAEPAGRVQLHGEAPGKSVAVYLQVRA